MSTVSSEKSIFCDPVVNVADVVDVAVATVTVAVVAVVAVVAIVAIAAVVALEFIVASHLFQQQQLHVMICSCFTGFESSLLLSLPVQFYVCFLFV